MYALLRFSSDKFGSFVYSIGNMLVILVRLMSSILNPS